MFGGAAFQLITPQRGFHLRLPNISSVMVQGHFLPSGDWWISTSVQHLLYGIRAMNRAFTSSCEASGLDPFSPLSYSVLDVPAVCPEPDWHLSSPLWCPLGFAKPIPAHSVSLLTPPAGQQGAFLPLGKQQRFSFGYRDSQSSTLWFG